MNTLLTAAAAIVALNLAVTPQRADAASPLSGQEMAEAAGHGLVGAPAPKLVLKTIDGNTIDLGSIYGKKAVYIKFWATWCIPCSEQMPHFQHTYESAGPDLAVIAINSGFNDSIDDVRTYRQRLGITMPIVLDDGQAGAAFNLRVTPQHIVIGRDGRIQYVAHDVDARLDAALLAARTTVHGGLRSAGTNAPISTRKYGVGDRLPDLSTPTVNGDIFHTIDTRVREPTVLVFMSPWCEWYLETSRPGLARKCRQVREQVDALARRESGVRWLAIASGLWATRDDLVDYRAKYKTEIPLTLDESGAIFRSFQVMNVPTLLIADANGKIVRRIDGFDADLPTTLHTCCHGRND